MEEILMTHSEIIKLVLNLRGMTVTQLSEKSGINRHTIYTIINRQQKKTSSKIYIPIAEALKIPESFFTNPETTSEDILHFIAPRITSRQVISDKSDLDRTSARNIERSSPKYLSELMTDRGVTVDAIFEVMKCTGFYSVFSFTELVDMIEKDERKDPRLFNFVENYLLSGIIATQDELTMLDKYRLLDSTERDYINSIIQNFLDVRNYINEKKLTTS